jgi:N-formylglutamate deformylase
MKLYHLLTPDQIRLPIAASLPHSGTYVPRHIARQIKKDPRPVLVPVDWHLEKLYDFLPDMGITVLQATHSRYVVNLNRELKEPLYGPQMSSVVSRENAFRTSLYDTEPDSTEVEERIKKYYNPYHRRLTGVIDKMVREFGRVYLLDLHSYFMGPETDVCLGNVNETTCSESLIGGFESALRRHGFSTVRNDLWVGGHITRHYATMENVETLQIELRFPAYLDREEFGEEEIIEWDSEKFRNAKERLRKAFGEFIDNLLFPADNNNR